MKTLNHFKLLSTSISWFWLLVFTLVPSGLIFMSFLSYHPIEMYSIKFTLSNFKNLFNLTYLHIFLRSIFVSSISTILCLVIAYPFALIISQAHPKIKNILLLLVIIPFWTSSLIRSYAIMALLKAKGIINSCLLSIGLINKPIQLLYTDTALFIGLVYTLLPFMILPLYANMARLDRTMIEAARDLGANRFTVFTKILLPMTMPGILSGIMLVFFPAMTLFYLPALLGGAKSMLLGNLIQNQFLTANNWPLGSATSIALITIMVLCLVIYWKFTTRTDREGLL